MAMEKPMLLALLRAYDAGARSAANEGAAPEGTGPAEASALGGHGQPRYPPEAAVVRRILDAPGPRGVDIGGSLVKLALALPKGEAYGKNGFPEFFGATGRTRYDLELDFELGGRAHVLRFVSGATAQIAGAVASVQAAVEAAAEAEEEEKEELAKADRRQGGTLFLPPPRPQRIFTAGGGAHKFAPLFRDALQTELVPVKELSAVVDGLLFLACCCGPAAQQEEVFTVGEDGTPSPAPWPEPLFPFLVVNIGSGVSILRVDSPEEGDYVRVGGTACGGGTFLGLARALTSARTFQEALHLADGGDASRCDLLVRDIYGEEGSMSLGLPAGLTAANCGRLCEDPLDCSEQDLARALLQMVTQQSVLLSGAFARHAGCVDRVFFAGGFVEEENHIARRAIAANFRSLGGRAYFLRHSDFLGALGSLRSCIQASNVAVSLAALQAGGDRLRSPTTASTTLSASPCWSSASSTDGS